MPKPVREQTKSTLPTLPHAQSPSKTATRSAAPQRISDEAVSPTPRTLLHDGDDPPTSACVHLAPLARAAYLQVEAGRCETNVVAKEPKTSKFALEASEAASTKSNP